MSLKTLNIILVCFDGMCFCFEKKKKEEEKKRKYSNGAMA